MYSEMKYELQINNKCLYCCIDKSAMFISEKRMINGVVYMISYVLYINKLQVLLSNYLLKQVKIHNDLPDIAILQNSFDTLNPKTGLGYLFLFSNNSNTSWRIVYML